jgi:hypothetical protein
LKKESQKADGVAKGIGSEYPVPHTHTQNPYHECSYGKDGKATVCVDS